MSPCRYVELPGGGYAIVRYSAPRRRQCGWCTSTGTLLCDFPVADRKTCDAPMCAAHGKRVGINLDYCPKHAAEAP